ncbi:zinc finger translocation-associated protein-like isoform X1 [Dunckerocampus dactyliophorus]|uniref:zinc finger translocation-associated protein-like isoform X1 n=1 Tax=Dunckerocampus dactyliophorus TaxID=161453 RepID=UPI002405F6F4|nr:zinc finger translocation-associated protein-like isoform X1 [Dunckerocampus dactyliophorus]
MSHSAEEDGERPRRQATTGSVMEDTAPGDSEPVDLRCGEQAKLLSLIIISGEEEQATHGHSDLGEEDTFVNGHADEESEAGTVDPIESPGTSYWSITEDPDQPLLLSPTAGPSRRKSRVQRASRPGLSRIPGRDHRRYYHEYWRSEYLMDFDPQRHGMICMVCGSSLATLKLSTIKRHIRQKHPDSLLWSAADKEVIRSGWESHLNLGGGQNSYGPSPQRDDDSLDSGHHAAEAAQAVAPEQQPQQELSLSPQSEAGEPQNAEEKEEQDVAGPSTRTLECYLNASLHAWFRQEFLMEYEAEPGRLLCMVCGAQLPSLHLDHIKSHVLDTHPDSLVFSSEEKHCVLQAWAQTHDEWENSIKSEANTKDDDFEPNHTKSDLCQEVDGSLSQSACLIREDGGMEAQQVGPQPLRQPRRRRLRGGNPWRLRLDYLIAYGPQGRGTYCMVCSQVLHETKVSSFRQHIQECHPETTGLSRQEREAMAAAWTKDYSTDHTTAQDEMSSSEAPVLNTTGGPNEDSSPDIKGSSQATAEDDDESAAKDKAKDGGTTATPSRHSHYPGKDQRRNYQVRWRSDFLMDYDCRRHGLICMVCGATLATLKVSTIKRHIQQVHAHSLSYNAEDKQTAMLNYDQNSMHFVHSDDCFFSQDHARTDMGPSPAHVST